MPGLKRMIRPKYVKNPQQQPEVRQQQNLSLADLVEMSRNDVVLPDYTDIVMEKEKTSILKNAPILTEDDVNEILGEGVPKNGAPSDNNLSNPGTIDYNTDGYRALRPIYDYKTSNKSFIKVHKQLELLGIRNNEFFLLLINPRLQGVNPHDPNISPELAMMVIEECQLNIFYYLREVVRIPQQGAGVVPFELDRGTLASIYCFINDINFYLIKPRQTGKSVGICAMMSWAFKFGITNGGFAFYANKEKNSKANLKRMKTYIGLLPSYMANMGTEMRDASGKVVRKVNNIKRYYEPTTGNTADVMNCAISESSAEELGRGDSHNFEFFDEAEFTTFIETTVQVSGMAFNTASGNALANGMHSCRLFATTPGDLSDERKCGSALKIVNDAVVWDENWYNVNPIELKRYIARKSSYRVVYIEYNYKQLGLGEAWFIRACSNVGNNVPKIRREILLQRFSGNSLSPFTEEDITELEENKQKPVKVIKFGKGGLYEIKFYVDPDEIKKNRVYFMGLDPSDGTGSDNYAMTVIDPYTFKTIIEFKSQYMSPQGCKELLEYLLSKWIPKAIICVEKNRNGTTLIDFLKESWIKSRIYASSEANMDTLLTREEYDDVGFLKDQLMRRKYYGISTNTNSRQMMMGLLVDSVKFKKDIIRSEHLIEDIKNLILRNGKIQAAPGKHDDCVMSWCIAMYTYYFGEKLERFGFIKGGLPTDMEEDDEFMQLQELYKNPLIRAQFPSMFSYYESTLKERMKKDHDEKQSMTLQNIADNDIGSITKDLAKLDPEYASKQIPQVEKASHAESLMDKWSKMGKGKKQQQSSPFNPYGGFTQSNRKNDDDGSWI